MANSIDYCPACTCGDLTLRAAVIAPFLNDYVFKGAGGDCNIAQCPRCGLQFFTTRLGKAEVGRLYAGYRGEAYFKARHRQEFWYTRRFHEALGSDADISNRRDLLHRTLARHVDIASIGSVLDYGGDRGQILSEGPGWQRYVFDLSGVLPIPGVEHLADEAALGRIKVDLILLCEVLEHASSPVDLLRQMQAHLRPGGLVFVTVPYEPIRFAGIPAGGWYRRYLTALRRYPALLRWADFYSTGFRVKFARIPPLGFAKMHEHLNLFTPAAMERALQAAEFTPLECGLASPAGPIVALARLADAKPQGSSAT